jgi:hypothetical protein
MHRCGSSLFQLGEYFEILAARVDPGRIRTRQRMRLRVRNDNEKVDPNRALRRRKPATLSVQR